MDRMIETSTTYQKNRIIIGSAIAFLVLLVIVSVYKWFFLNIKQPVELFFEIMLIFMLWERAAAEYTYEASAEGLQIMKHSLFGTKTFAVTYEDVLGMYLYTPQLLTPVRYRRTFRLHSALDPKDVWTLAYEVKKENGKIENRRIFFKPSDAMLAFLNQKLPEKSFFRGGLQ